MNAQHTPGPWEIEGEGQTTTAIFALDNHAIAHLSGRVQCVQDANAALIAAAPDTLAALELALAWEDKLLSEENRHRGPDLQLPAPPWTVPARIAIAKAKGAP